MTVVSDRIAWTFNKSTATQAVALDTCKAFDRVWYTGLLHKLKPQGISDHLFGLILPFLSNRRPRVVLDGKSLQEYPVNFGVRQGSILGLTLFPLYINGVSNDVFSVILLSLLMTLLCDQASDW